MLKFLKFRQFPFEKMKKKPNSGILWDIMEQWLSDTARYLEASYGLASGFARDIARLLAYLYQYGLNPRVTSGWRDPAKQKAMQKRWDAGDRAGLRARPAADSLHSAESWGRPAAQAIDIVTSNEQLAAQIARALKIGAGLDFKNPDPGHYYSKG